MKIASFHSDIDSPKNLSYASIGRLDQLSSIKVRGTLLCHQLLIALRFYATGCFQLVDGDLFGVHKSTVCRIVRRVSKAIARLKGQYTF